MRGLKKDVLNGAIIAVISSGLFIVSVVLHAPTGRHDGSNPRVALESEPAPSSAPTTRHGEDHAGAFPNATVVPVLCHHYIRRDTSPLGLVRILGALFLNLPILGNMDVWTQTEAAFDRQMAYLKEHGYTSITMDDLAAWRKGQRILPKKSVVITFDDGDRSAMDIGLPILKKYGMKATMFVVTEQVGTDWQGIRGLTWEELRRLQDSGVFSIESHTSKLHYTVKTSKGHLPVIVAMSRGLYPDPSGKAWLDVILRDLVRSRRLIAEHLSHDARHLAWPYGATTPEIDSLATLAGFHTLSTMRISWKERLPAAPVSPEVDRYAITARTSIRGFARIVLP